MNNAFPAITIRFGGAVNDTVRPNASVTVTGPPAAADAPEDAAPPAAVPPEEPPPHAPSASAVTAANATRIRFT